MNNYIHLLSLLFIWSEIHHILFKSRLYLRFNERTESIPKIDIFYYIVKIMYIIYLFFGLFSQYYIYFAMIIMISLLKFPIFYIASKTKSNIKLSFSYDVLSSISCIIILLQVLYLIFLGDLL
jgi:hypothetical protein